MLPRSITTPLDSDRETNEVVQRMDHSASARIQKAREIIRRDLDDMKLPASSINAPQVDSERCALSFAPENEDPEKMNNTGRGGWRKSAVRRRDQDSPVCIICISGMEKCRPKAWYSTFLKNYMFNLDDSDSNGDEVQHGHLGPVFTQHGTAFLSFWSKKAAFLSFRLFQEELPHLRLEILPSIYCQTMVDREPVLFFVNSTSGGGQGKKVADELKYYFSRYQVFELHEGGPFPGLFTFRNVAKFRIIVCGGDGTLGWVLQGVEDLHKYLTCSQPAIAVLPLGTGNDLSRVMGWGKGYTGSELVPILQSIQNADKCFLDRWNILIDSYKRCDKCEGRFTDPTIAADLAALGRNDDTDETESSMTDNSEMEIYKRNEKMKLERQMTFQAEVDVQVSFAGDGISQATGDTIQTYENGNAEVTEASCEMCIQRGVKMVTMSNYFGIGLDAEIALSFHRSRQENPSKFNSRLLNKMSYFKASLQKFQGPSKYINNVITLSCDGEEISLPEIQGLIFTNIPSWGSGNDVWKVQQSSGSQEGKWLPQNISDGVLECIGVTGFSHLAAISSAVRSGIRIAQGTHFRIQLLSNVPVQVDGEPWEQKSSQIVISPGGIQARLLKKAKRR
ncbi:unnamed protein product [Oikopleura dioica]|uniref:Diacylglycerol kinase n=1 Tax=Oikopleura dioica TaxID=34765 RepID=E4WXZ0_OIKDI|nr:unnamed protein product [Oikopleura dioica]